ncbi:hypothetical protein G9A89_022169 [Geosiphon pyriformis]|nr:hypothetical protein G9A89_022169 [Geosiphon pyriformis]
MGADDVYTDERSGELSLGKLFLLTQLNVLEQMCHVMVNRDFSVLVLFNTFTAYYCNSVGSNFNTFKDDHFQGDLDTEVRPKKEGVCFRAAMIDGPMKIWTALAPATERCLTSLSKKIREILELEGLCGGICEMRKKIQKSEIKDSEKQIAICFDIL